MKKILFLAALMFVSAQATADELDELRPYADTCRRHQNGSEKNGSEFAPGFEDCKELTEKFSRLAAERAAKQASDEAERIRKALKK